MGDHRGLSHSAREPVVSILGRVQNISREFPHGGGLLGAVIWAVIPGLLRDLKRCPAGGPWG